MTSKQSTRRPARRAVRWATTLGASYAGSPAVANGVVYVGAQAFRASDGVRLWNGGCTCASSVISNGLVYLTIAYDTLAFGL